FAIQDSSLCAVAMYDADADLSGLQPSWGSHGGPLSIPFKANADGSVGLTRWQVPSGATGTLTSTGTTVKRTPDPNKSPYMSQPAIDLPFFGLSAFAWTGSGDTGEIVLTNGSSPGPRYATNGTLAMVAIASDSSHGRLLYTGQSLPGVGTTG